ncbi:MAG: transglutaminase domain-containing protein [Gammaproteobacteria bacterium]
MPRPILPPGWLAMGLVFWGLGSANLAGGAVMAALLEALRRAPWKWNIADRDCHRAADLTSVIFALGTVIQFQRHGVHGIYEILAITPYCLFPLVLTQTASTRQSLPMSALFYSLRRRAHADRPIDVAPYYLGACILAASTTTLEPQWYAAGVVVLTLGVVWRARPGRFDWRHWSAAVGLAAALGLAALAGLQAAQRQLEHSFLYWFHQFPWASPNPNREVTAIGTIGRLKLSDQIRVRVTPNPQLSIPLLLEQAHYDTFRYGTWTATDAPFAAVDAIAGAQRWPLNPALPASTATTEITLQHRHELSLLPVPRGAQAIESPEIAELQGNRFGTLMAESPPGALRFRVETAAATVPKDEPGPADRQVPDAYAAAIRNALEEAAVTHTDAARDAARIRNYFLENFTYSLVQRGGLSRRTPLVRFLRDTRHGHCEYFATATVLMLRAAGIPARYAVGYVVEDRSVLEDAYIARARHAHAWASAYIDGRWAVIDSTPSVWFDLEQDAASHWQGVQDVLAWLWYRYQRLGQTDFTAFGNTLLWLVPPLAIVLYRRLRKSPNAVRVPPPTTAPRSPSGQASLIAPIMTALSARGLQPAAGETVRQFLSRTAPTADDGDAVRAIVNDYYHLRFARHPLPEPSRRQLETRIARYLRKL